MREILFRGRCIDYDETYGWVEGYYVHLQDVWKNRDVHRIYNGFSESDCYGFYPDYYKVDPDTIGQFTGLIDKDGNKIFEGDILEYRSNFDWGGEEINHVVVFWEEHRWSYETIYSNRWTENWNNKGHRCDVYKGIVEKYGKVIGNIHDNPELLG